MSTRILLVEDEENLHDLMKMNLELEGFKVIGVNDGNIAMKTFKEEQFDLVILDVMLPGADGIRVCENIRLQNNSVPILFVSAKGTSEDRVAGLKKGGDDYITKPFNLEEFILRVQKLIARNKPKPESHTAIHEYKFGNNYINFESYEAVGQQGSFMLTKKEIMLLKLLIENKGEVVSRERILSTVWGYAVFPSTRTIDNFVLAFRKYFEKDPKNPKFFTSLRGVGYKFTDS